MGTNTYVRRGAAILAAGLVVPLLVTSPAVAEPEPSITFPADGSTVDQGEMTVRGTISADGSDTTHVIYAVDVSGSTGSAGFDCNGDGSVEAADDFNGDGVNGETLDCEIAGVIALNTSLAAIPGSVDGIRVGMVPFGSSAAVADVGGQPGHQDFVAPTDDNDDNDRDRTADIAQVAGSLDQGSVTLFQPHNVGTGTSFTNALETSFDVLEDESGRLVVFLLTDGIGSLSEATLDRMEDLGVEVRPFAIGAGSDRCRSGGNLDRIGQRSGVDCTYSASPTELQAALTGQPPGIDRVEVSLDGGSPIEATIDQLGNFSAEVFATSGEHTVEVSVHYANGAVETSTSTFTASTAGTSFVALGDSYSAGEGITPYRDVPGPGEGCHQSTRGFATFVGEDGFSLPNGQNVQLDYVSCSGAVLKNLTAVPQNARGETHVVQLDRISAADDLVAFTIGGNDVAFSEVVKHCATQFQCYEDGFATLTSGRSLSLDEFLQVRLRLFEPEVGSLYRTIRERTGNNAMVVAMDYPELFDDGILLRLGCFEKELFSRDEREYLNEKAVDLRDVLERQAASAGVHFADVIEEFKGNRICDGGINTQGEWLVGVDVTKDIAGDASFHPDDTGAEAYARILTEYIDDAAADGGPTTPAGLPQNPAPTATVAARHHQATTAADTGPDLTDAELAEVAAMEFGSLDVEGLSFRRGEGICPDRVAMGEHVVVTGHGFGPHAEVSVSATSAAEEGSRELGTVTADADGRIEASLVVPFDLPPSEGLEGDHPWSAIRIDAIGPTADGASRRLNVAAAVDPPHGTCTTQLTDAGDIAAADGGPAPSAEDSDAPTTLLTAGPAGPRIDVMPDSTENEVAPDSNQQFEVALLSSPGFDATTVRHSKMRLGPGAGQVPMGSQVTDVNSDGWDDLLLRHMARQTGVTCGQTVVWLRADDPKAVDGRFEAADRIRTIDCDE